MDGTAGRRGRGVTDGSGWVALLPALALLTMAGALGHLRLGAVAVALSAVVWTAYVPTGTLGERVLAFVLAALAAVMLLGLVGPLLPTAFSPAGVAVAVAVPAAVVLVASRLRASTLRRPPTADVAVGLTTLAVAGWLFWRPFHGPAQRLLASMMLGGSDYLAHFDQFETAWWHHGFPFVASHHAILEPRAGLAATPYGAHVAMAGLAMTLGGHAALPTVTSALHEFAAGYVVVGVLFVAMFFAAVSRLMRSAAAPTWLRLVALAAVGASCLVGLFSALWSDGFLTYLLGVGATLSAVAVTAAPERLRWRHQAAVLFAATVVGAFAYTLTAPVLLLVAALFLVRTRSIWLTPGRRVLAGAWAVALLAVVGLAVVPTLPSTHALDNTGGVQQIGFALPVVATVVVAVVALRARRALPTVAVHLAVLTVGLGVFVLGFAGVQLAVAGQVRYYADKLAYLWLAVAILALLALAPSLVSGSPLFVARWRHRAVAALAVGCMLWSATGGLGGRPALSLAFPNRLDAAAARHADALASDVVTAARLPGPQLRVLWGPRVSDVPNRWVAILQRRWTGVADGLFMKLHITDRFEGLRLRSWLASHPDVAVELVAVNRRWFGYAFDAAGGRTDVTTRDLSDAAVVLATGASDKSSGVAVTGQP